MKFDSLLAKMDRLPPCWCRLFARRRVVAGDRARGWSDTETGWVPKSHSDIAQEAGLSKSTVAELSQRKTWRGTPIGQADAFALACGVNLAEIDEAIKRLRYHRTRLQHLGRGNGHQRRMIAELLDNSRQKPGSRHSGDNP